MTSSKNLEVLVSGAVRVIQRLLEVRACIRGQRKIVRNEHAELVDRCDRGQADRDGEGRAKYQQHPLARAGAHREQLRSDRGTNSHDNRHEQACLDLRNGCAHYETQHAERRSRREGQRSPLLLKKIRAIRMSASKPMRARIPRGTVNSDHLYSGQP